MISETLRNDMLAKGIDIELSLSILEGLNSGSQAPAPARPVVCRSFAVCQGSRVKTRPGIRIQFGSSARLSERIVSISAALRVWPR